VDKGLDYFTPLAACDSVFEGDTEWTVTEAMYRDYLADLVIDGPLVASRQFEFNAPNDSNPDMRPILDSTLSYEMTMTDTPIVVKWDVTERDPILDEVMSYEAIELHPSDGTRHIYQNFDLSPWGPTGACRAAISVDVTVNLLKPQITLQDGQLPPPTTTTPTTTPPPPPTTTLPPPPAPTPTKPPACRPPANPRNCQEQ
jgi:hypothetical protein